MSRPYYTMTIHETARPSPRSDPEEDQGFNVCNYKFYDEADVIAAIKERYGDNFKPKRKTYEDRRDGYTYEVGFVRSYWNKDISHNSKSWWQTDWVHIMCVNETPVIIEGNFLVKAKCVSEKYNKISPDIMNP